MTYPPTVHIPDVPLVVGSVGIQHGDVVRCSPLPRPGEMRPYVTVHYIPVSDHGKVLIQRRRVTHDRYGDVLGPWEDVMEADGFTGYAVVFPDPGAWQFRAHPDTVAFQYQDNR